MNYLVHPHDFTAVLAANFLETLGGNRLIFGVPTGTPRSEAVAIVSSGSKALKGKIIRRLREDNQEVLGVKIPTWALGAKEVILINPLRASESSRQQLQDTLRQLHARLTETPMARTSKNRRRRSRRRGTEIIGALPL